MHLSLLEPGDAADATGTVVRSTMGYAVMRPDQPADPGTIYWPHSALITADLGESAQRRIGELVTVIGLWTGSGIAHASFSPHLRPPEPDGYPTVYVEAEPGHRSPLDPHAFHRAWPSILELTNEGVLLSHERTRYEVHVVTLDVERTERILRPFYGDALAIRACPFPPSVLALIEEFEVLADHQEVLFGTGGGFEFDGSTRTIELSHVTPKLQDLARGIPDGALTVTAQARPALAR